MAFQVVSTTGLRMSRGIWGQAGFTVKLDSRGGGTPRPRHEERDPAMAFQVVSTSELMMDRGIWGA